MKLHTPEEFGFSSERLARINTVTQRYVDEGKYAGFVTLVARRGAVVHLEKCGLQDIQKNKPLELDTLFRIYSMTKPITSVALMMLYEQGLIRLEDPVSRFAPEFKNVRVLESGGRLVEPRREITVHHLLTHTAGLGYGDEEDSLIDKLYRDVDLENIDSTNEEVSRKLAGLPLRFHPGESWHYSYATDVIGRLVEIISGVSLGEFFEENIFKPLGIEETFFRIPEKKVNRFAELYGKTEKGPLEIIDVAMGGDFFKVVRDSGGAGLISKAEDYFRFAQFFLNKGELNGVRLLSPKTVELMRANHLPPDILPINMGDPWPRVGFGLGFNVWLDDLKVDMRGSAGSHGWGGWASTQFWIDPVEEIIGILMVQLIPSYTYPIVNDLRTAVYQAVID